MLYEITVPQFIKFLQNFSAILGRTEQYAASKKIEPEVILQSRLAPDQFPLSKQIQVFCDMAKLCTSRLTGKDAPVNDDKEKTIPEFKDRISSTIAYLEKFNAADFKDTENKKITTPRWEGKHLLGSEYVLLHALPNFYFHLTTAYSILRHNGLEIGKKDYLGPMPFRD